MENDPILYLLVILAGLGGGAVAAGSSLVGYKPNPEDPPRPRCPFCPPLFGGVLAVIIWLLIGRGAEPEGLLVTATVVGFVMGTAGGALSNIFVGLSGRR